MGTCNLHHVHTAYMKGLMKLNFRFDKLAQNLHFFFKLSSARRQDYALCELETDVEAHVMLRHVSSLKYVLMRIIDHWENLSEYFLVFLPKQKSFDREIFCTERYIAIETALKGGDVTKLYMSFAIYLAGIMQPFLLRFQLKKPVIHLTS